MTALKTKGYAILPTVYFVSTLVLLTTNRNISFNFFEIFSIDVYIAV